MEALERATPRPTLSNRAAYRLAGGVIGLGLFASITPTPLYGTYSVLWHFSPLTLTLIYATYAFGVLTTLLLAGPAGPTGAGLSRAGWGLGPAEGEPFHAADAVDIHRAGREP